MVELNVEYSRTVKPCDYESIRVTHPEPYGVDGITKEEAFEKARRWVHKKINEELFHLGVDQLNFYPDLVIKWKER